MAADVRVKRVYDEPEPGDGYRVLIDHIWPRGVSRERARLDDWARDLAPSDGLRRWFAHDPERFDAFRARYVSELANRRARIRELARRGRSGTVTIVYAARDREHNNAVVLAEMLRDDPNPPPRTVPQGDEVDASGAASFPASDPPSWWGGR